MEMPLRPTAVLALGGLLGAALARGLGLDAHRATAIAFWFAAPLLGDLAYQGSRHAAHRVWWLPSPPLALSFGVAAAGLLLWWSASPGILSSQQMAAARPFVHLGLLGMAGMLVWDVVIEGATHARLTWRETRSLPSAALTIALLGAPSLFVLGAPLGLAGIGLLADTPIGPALALVSRILLRAALVMVALVPGLGLWAWLHRRAAER